MKPVFEEIRQQALPFLDTRHNDVHTAISTVLAFELLEREGGDEDIVIPAIKLRKTLISLETKIIRFNCLRSVII